MSLFGAVLVRSERRSAEGVSGFNIGVISGLKELSGIEVGSRRRIKRRFRTRTLPLFVLI